MFIPLSERNVLWKFSCGKLNTFGTFNFISLKLATSSEWILKQTIKQFYVVLFIFKLLSSYSYLIIYLSTTLPRLCLPATYLDESSLFFFLINLFSRAWFGLGVVLNKMDNASNCKMQLANTERESRKLGPETCRRSPYISGVTQVTVNLFLKCYDLCNV